MTGVVFVPERLRRAYGDRLAAARAHHAGGGLVVGYTGPTIPLELIHALGAMPVLIAAESPHPTPVADALIERSEPWPLRSVAERALDGTVEFLDLLIVSRAEEWLYYNLKEAVRVGLGARVPPLHMFDLIQDPAPAVSGYNAMVVRSLSERLQRQFRPLKRGALTESVAVYNRRRSLLREYVAQRDRAYIPGTAAMQVIGAGHFLSPEEHCVSLCEVVAAGPMGSRTSKSPRVLLATSEPLFHLALHTIVEEAGGNVVAEDTWFGSRCSTPDVRADEDAVSGLTGHYVRETQGDGVQPLERRDAWVRSRLGHGDLEVLLLYVPPADRRFGWDCPRLESMARGCNVVPLVVRSDVLTEDGRDAALQQIRSGLRGAASAGGS